MSLENLSTREPAGRDYEQATFVLGCLVVPALLIVITTLAAWWVDGRREVAVLQEKLTRMYEIQDKKGGYLYVFNEETTNWDRLRDGQFIVHGTSGNVSLVGVPCIARDLGVIRYQPDDLEASCNR